MKSISHALLIISRETETRNAMQWVCVADLQTCRMKGFIPGFAPRKAASADCVAVKGELQTMDGKKERGRERLS